MEKQANQPIPLTILTGFLGAGKTTLLNRILHSDHGIKIAVLVNDFGSINIDSQLVVNVDADDTIQLSNGCICCTIRGDLLQAMLNLVERPEPPEYVIIEASGVSDPLEISLTFRMPELQSRIQVDSVLTVIDAEQIRSLERENETLAVLQIGAADIVAINKVDLVSENELHAVKDWVRSIIPTARILEMSYGNAPLELMLGVGRFSPDRLLHHHGQDIHVHDTGETHDHHHKHEHTDHSMVFSTWSWTGDEPLSLKEVRRFVDRLPVSVFRAKGILYLADNPEQAAVLQMVGKRVNVTWGDAWINKPHSQFVIIGEHDSLNAEMLRTQFEKCLAKNAPKSELQRIGNRMLEWVRGK